MKTRIPLLALLLVLLVIGLIGGLTTAQALEIRQGQQVIIEEGDVVPDDLYVSGQTIVINGTVQGDVLAMGQSVIVRGEIQGDLMVMAQSVVIAGQVQDDVRAMAAIIQVPSGGQVGDDLLGMGFSLETQPDTSVGGTVLFYGSQAQIAGDVGEDVKVGVGGLSLQGHIHGNVEAEVGEAGKGTNPGMFMYSPGGPAVPVVPPGLTVEGATIDGELHYKAPHPYQIPADIHATYEPVPSRHRQPTPLDRALNALRLMVSFFLVGLVLMLVKPVHARLMEPVRQKPGKTMLWGVVAAIGAFILFLLLGVILTILVLLLMVLTLGKLGMTVLVTGFILLMAYGVGLYILTTWIGPVLAGLWLSGLILRRDASDGNRYLLVLALGAILMGILIAIPYLGGLVAFLTGLLALGAVLDWLMSTYQMKEKAQEMVVAE